MKAHHPVILVVDDEVQVHRFLKPALKANGYEPLQARSGAEALEVLARLQPEAVVLDLGLPDVDGQDLLFDIRRVYAGAVIILSARGLEVEKVMALDNGADDYVEKPFAMGELMARVRAAIRNRLVQAGVSPVIQSADLEIDLTRRVVKRGERVLSLTPKEYALLQFLVRAGGRIVTHRQLLTEIWGPDHAEQVQYVRVLIGHLRGKIEADPTTPQHILTASGIGYRFSV
jgi:two-component system KDP operon response regulator KdpE